MGQSLPVLLNEVRWKKRELAADEIWRLYKCYIKPMQLTESPENLLYKDYVNKFPFLGTDKNRDVPPQCLITRAIFTARRAAMWTCRDTANAAHLAGFNLSRVGKCLKVHSCSTGQEILPDYVRKFITMYFMFEFPCIVSLYYIRTNKMQLLQYCLLVTARLLYTFRTLSASIIRSTKTVVAATGACHGSGW